MPCPGKSRPGHTKSSRLQILRAAQPVEKVRLSNHAKAGFFV